TAVTCTYSAADGTYSFSNIALGTYTVVGEVAGKLAYPVTVVIDDKMSSVSTVNLSVNHNSVTGSIETGIRITDKVLNDVKVFPNPVTDKLNIVTNLNTSQMAHVQIFDINGKQVSNGLINIASGPQNTEINASVLTK